MASYPSYDPNVLATHNGKQLNSADQALLKQPGNPLLNRAINYTWPPGSTFKIVTSSAYLTRNPSSTPQTNVYSPTQLKLPQTTHILTNNDGEVCGNGSGQASLLTAFAQSCDTTFGSLGMTLTGPVLNNFAELFGMNSKTLRIPMPVTQSNYVIPPSQAADRVLGHRAVQRHGDPAAGGHARGDHRQRRQADEAIPGQAGHGQRPEHCGHDHPDPAEPAGLALGGH